MHTQNAHENIINSSTPQNYGGIMEVEVSWDPQSLHKMLINQHEMLSKNAHSKCTLKHHQDSGIQHLRVHSWGELMALG